MIPVVSDVNTGKALVVTAYPQPLVVPHQVSSGTNRLLLVALAFNQGNMPGSTGAVGISVDWNGTPLTLLDSHETLFNLNRVEWWYLLNPATGVGNVNVTATNPPPGFGYAIVIGAVTLSAVSQTLPFGPRVKADSGPFISDGDAVAIIPSLTSQLMLATVSARQNHDLIPQPPITQIYKDVQVVGFGGGGTDQHAGGTMPGTGANVTFNWANPILTGLDEEWAIMGAPINYETAAALVAPDNVHAVQRENYTLLWWDPVVRDVGGNPVTVTSYQVFRSSLLNENDQELLATVTTTDASGAVDTAFVDTSAPSPAAYRIVAVAGMVQSDLSEKAVAIYAPSQIDSKAEVIDQQLLFWDEGNWDEELLS